MADMYSGGLINNTLDGGLRDDTQLENAKKELEIWKTKVEKADDIKGRLILEKLEEDEIKMKTQQEMIACIKKQEKHQKEFDQSLSMAQDEVHKLEKHKQDLLGRYRRFQAELEAKRADSTKLKQKFKICTQIPDTEVNFVAQNVMGEEASDELITGVFTISQKPAVLLRGGQALITFEEEKVAAKVLKLAKCIVSYEDNCLDVRPVRISMDPAVKFEVHLNISRKDLKFSNVPPSMPEERMMDRLQMSFSRPSRGGGEVERVEYDKNTGTGCIKFLHPGAADRLALNGRYPVDLDSEVTVQVAPVYNYQLRKFETFCGSAKRTILLDDIEDMDDDEELQDNLEIYFQKPSNCGGEIENIKYISSRKALKAFFCEDTAETDE